jgi:hypothetical protein
MTRYLISFDDGTMNFPEEDLPSVGEAALIRRETMTMRRRWRNG